MEFIANLQICDPLSKWSVQTEEKKYTVVVAVSYARSPEAQLLLPNKKKLARTFFWIPD